MQCICLKYAMPVHEYAKQQIIYIFDVLIRQKCIHVSTIVYIFQNFQNMCVIRMYYIYVQTFDET